MSSNRNSFSSSLGFILAAAGSAVGLGNIWRFPYLAAKDGGGLFLLVYIVLALTFGFTLLFSEIAIGRKTKQSSLTAYGKLNKGFGWLGGFSVVVPFLILPYYCIIGGWVLNMQLHSFQDRALLLPLTVILVPFIKARFRPSFLT